MIYGWARYFFTIASALSFDAVQDHELGAGSHWSIAQMVLPPPDRGSIPNLSARWEESHSPRPSSDSRLGAVGTLGISGDSSQTSSRTQPSCQPTPTSISVPGAIRAAFVANSDR